MKQFGLIGHQLSHSFSQDYFRSKFKKMNLDADYLNFELDTIDAFTALKVNSNISGFNVTIPYKETIIPFLDELRGDAAEIQAVNTVKKEGNKWIGYNTDAFGFKQMIGPFLKGHQHKALVFGTGGASKAVAFVLEKIGLEVNFVSRNPKGKNQFDYEEINENMIQFHQVLINTTPVGMYPDVNECITLPFGAITSDHLVIDLIYNPQETLFLKKAKSFGAIGLNGLTMLEQQAERSWEIWNA